mmetsp:Transcript_122219/g.353382  ORF Transcript_122219/g.353382 Transcript_122219/m.353382 type:complete len:329 (-) Transcript_122219:1422-2408(-)
MPIKFEHDPVPKQLQKVCTPHPDVTSSLLHTNVRGIIRSLFLTATTFEGQRLGLPHIVLVFLAGLRREILDNLRLLARLQVNDAVRDVENHLPVVRSEDDGTREVAQAPRQGLDTVQVQVVARLVQNQQVGPLCGYARKCHAHTLPRGQCRHVLLRCLDAPQTEGLQGLLKEGRLVANARQSNALEAALQVLKCGDLAEGFKVAERLALLLRHKTPPQPACALHCPACWEHVGDVRHRRQRARRNVAIRGRMLHIEDALERLGELLRTQEQSQKRCLPCPVLPHQRDFLTIPHCQIDVIEDKTRRLVARGAVGKGRAVESHDLIAAFQ